MSRFLACALVALAALAAGCASLPPLDGRAPSHAYADTDTSTTRLGRASAAVFAPHPGLTGIRPLPDPRDAFAARVLLADRADRSLDVQYYIWHDDESGVMLLHALWRAAGRGVRVRLLVDDLGSAGIDSLLSAFDAHPNAEVRLYNPFVQRGSRALGFVTDFARLNRRMHNKSFTADSRLSVLGGRNIGNEYFDVAGAVAFEDLDVLAVGAVVRDVADAFDLYWNSPSAYPLAIIVGPPSPAAAADLAAAFAATRADPDSIAYAEAVRATPLVQELDERRLTVEWTRARLVRDDPAKTLDAEMRRETLLFPVLVRDMGRPSNSLDLVSPYFVPGDGGAEALADLARAGVKVRILTNSLSASDSKVVHAGYAKHRAALLRAGVRLYEMKPLVAPKSRAKGTSLGGSSRASLHAKTFGVDRQRIFVGSFNFDQRSALLNTELGVVIDSPLLAGRLADTFDQDLARVAYEVRLDPDGSLVWIDSGATGETRYDVDPETSVWLRSTIDFLSRMPIDWLL
jgi:putative cardiolipin synthase